MGLDECTAFQSQDAELIRRSDAEHAWLISRNAISLDGRALIDRTLGLRCFTFEEFQRTIMNVDGYQGCIRSAPLEHRGHAQLPSAKRRLSPNLYGVVVLARRYMTCDWEGSDGKYD
ncbi:hypothetical protein [Sphingomonas koreensis]|uniref:hypothetical protein n=1 Tax=Sphingomonas koreensis TaxID=93064 RepID=UPI00234F3D3A|nr:hypothetical protein [Sphingomonas koreensis]MDC7812835.1 hypothetical protein [Sphingomonas koreensis]